MSFLYIVKLGKRHVNVDTKWDNAYMELETFVFRLHFMMAAVHTKEAIMVGVNRTE